MKKILGLITIAALALMGCDSKQAHAQNSVSGEVGTPDSANMLIIEQGYEAVTVPAPNDGNMQPLPGDPGVDVEPAPNAAQPAPNKNSDGTTNSANPNYDGTLTIDETVTEETVAD